MIFQKELIKNRCSLEDSQNISQILESYINNAMNEYMKDIKSKKKKQKRKEEREYQDDRRREDRAYKEFSKQAAHQRSMDRQNMALRRQVVSASERIEHHRLHVSEQKVKALKQVACDYLRNNPNRVDYIRVRF